MYTIVYNIVINQVGFPLFSGAKPEAPEADRLQWVHFGHGTGHGLLQKQGSKEGTEKVGENVKLIVGLIA